MSFDSKAMKASNQWANRPMDERYLSLDEMYDHFVNVTQHSAARVVPSKRLNINPTSNTELVVTGPNGHAYQPTHWAFGQLASLAKAPAGYLRTIPAPLAADCINYGLQFQRDIEDVGVLLTRLPSETLSESVAPGSEHNTLIRAATGPNYGRIWNRDVVHALRERFGDGVTGSWRVPGEFGRDVVLTRENTTLYASDRDMFVFLADERNRVSIPNRRDGKSGDMARGFFVWNSEVGASTFGVGMFLFDFVCCNRIVWGMNDYQEIRIRHTSAAPERFLHEITPALNRYADSSWEKLEVAIAEAKKDQLGDKLGEFMATRFGSGLVESMKKTHEIEEGRPIETRWDVVTAATAVARSYVNQDTRVKLEREAGKLLG